MRVLTQILWTPREFAARIDTRTLNTETVDEFSLAEPTDI